MHFVDNWQYLMINCFDNKPFCWQTISDDNRFLISYVLVYAIMSKKSSLGRNWNSWILIPGVPQSFCEGGCCCFTWPEAFHPLLFDTISHTSMSQCHNYPCQYFFFNWDSPHARLNSHYEAWSYKKKSTKKIIRDYRKSV